VGKEGDSHPGVPGSRINQDTFVSSPRPGIVVPDPKSREANIENKPATLSTASVDIRFYFN
jgi:hypothetical protein